MNWYTTETRLLKTESLANNFKLKVLKLWLIVVFMTIICLAMESAKQDTKSTSFFLVL
jgi:hypothetical protein